MNPKTPQSSRRGPIIIYAILLLLMLFAMYKLFDASGAVDLKYSDVVTLIKQENIR